MNGDIRPSEMNEATTLTGVRNRGTSIGVHVFVLGAVVALLATACGSRVGDRIAESAARPPAPVDGDGGGTNGGGDDRPDGAEGDVAMFGTMEAPCSPAPDDWPDEVSTGPGLTAEQIRIGVISDKAGVVKVPTVSVEESVRAFVDWCNDHGGVNGRTLVLETYDAKLSAGDEAAKQACADDLFALVGTGAVMDDLVAPVAVGCDLVNVAGYTATAKMALADLTFTPLPNPSTHFNTAPGRWMAEQFPDAVEHAGMLAANLPTATIQADRITKAYEMIGMDFVYRKDTDILQTSYAAEVGEMKSAGVRYLSMVSATSETVKLLKDLKASGYEVDVIDLGQQYYDQELLGEPGAEGAYVQTNTTPFEDIDDVPALQDFQVAYDAIGTKVQPSSLGVQAFSAGLLFATAARNAGADLTRDTLVSELASIKEWDAGGLHFSANPGDNAASHCFMYLRVKDGEFHREFPAEPGTFECLDESVVVDLESDYGGGAKTSS